MFCELWDTLAASADSPPTRCQPWPPSHTPAPQAVTIKKVSRHCQRSLGRQKKAPSQEASVESKSTWKVAPHQRPRSLCRWVASWTQTAGLAHLVRSTSDKVSDTPKHGGPQFNEVLQEPAKLQTQGSSTTVEVKLPALVTNLIGKHFY